VSLGEFVSDGGFCGGIGVQARGFVFCDQGLHLISLLPGRGAVSSGRGCVDSLPRALLHVKLHSPLLPRGLHSDVAVNLSAFLIRPPY
jgi:hypothetical protein